VDAARREGIRGVLFDLDGTLLQVEMGTFIPAYVRGLSACFADLAPRGLFAEVVRATTFALLTSDDGTVTNEELFLSGIERHLGIAADLFNERLLSYCQDGLQSLASLVRPLPLARPILKACFARGLKVAIATNPVFPRPLVEARLAWAGVADFPFELVTCYDDSRYCKPHPHYFHDVLARLGLAPEETLMVGNDTEHDLGAGQAGIATFLVDTWMVDRLQGAWACDFRGGHPELFRFVESLGGTRNN
jgi:FMN phosphatase YigB (HAD superfamily)